MTLDEAIKHCEEVAQGKRYEYQECLAVHDMENAMDCEKCGEEHEQLAEWLKDLKKLKEKTEPQFVRYVQDGLAEDDCITYCPNCDELLNDYWDCSYCPYCGQALEW